MRQISRVHATCTPVIPDSQADPMLQKPSTSRSKDGRCDAIRNEKMENWPIAFIICVSVLFLVTVMRI